MPGHQFSINSIHNWLVTLIENKEIFMLLQIRFHPSELESSPMIFVFAKSLSLLKRRTSLEPPALGLLEPSLSDNTLVPGQN